MGIKLRMYIELPYAIQLDSKKNYSFDFNFAKFETFSMEFIRNIGDTEGGYNPNFSEDFCLRVKIIAVFKELEYNNYPCKRIPYADTRINEYTVELPKRETKLVFLEVNKVLDRIFSYVRKKTGMFWVDNISITPINFLHNTIIRYSFYSTNASLSDSFVHTISYSSFFMETDAVDKIKENTFDDFESYSAELPHYEKYLDKARISLHEKIYENFIIYLSIVVEAFIREYVGKLALENDIIYDRLTSRSDNYLDLYYNVLLKYFKGKSLNELHPDSYTLMKRMYNLRNGLMHNDKIDEKVLRKAGIKKIDFKECKKMLEAFKKAYDTINNL